MSAGLPRGAPASTQLATFPTSSSVREMSFLYFWMPMFFSMNQGGMTSGLSRSPVLYLMAFAHGLVSLKVSIENGPI